MSRLIAIGLDAADPDLIDSLIERGLMPNLAQFESGATRFVIRNTPGLFVGSIWPTFSTGLTPARHGRYCWRQLRGGTYDDEFFQPDQLLGERFWDRIDEAGADVMVVDIPKACVSHGFRGAFIKDWGTHDPSAGGFQIQGHFSKENFLSRYGTESVGACDRIARSPQGYHMFESALIDRIRTRTRILSDLMCKHWNLLITCFSEAHCVGHQCWHLHDSGHTAHSSELASIVGDPVVKVYCELDSALGELLRHTANSDRIIIFATHGMGRHYSGVDMLPEMVSAASARVRDKETISVPAGPIPPIITMDSRFFRRSQAAFTIPNNNAFAAIRINLKGREPAGIVSERDSATFLSNLQSELLSFRNCANGDPIFVESILASNVFSRVSNDSLPDLMLKWNRQVPIDSVVSTTCGRFNKPHSGVRSGDHTANGCAWFRGEMYSPALAATDISMEDFAPTICAAFGLDAFNSDGRVLKI